MCDQAMAAVTKGAVPNPDSTSMAHITLTVKGSQIEQTEA